MECPTCSDPTITKQCKSCDQIKPLSDFFHHKHAKDGHNSACKICTSSKVKEWHRNNPHESKRNALGRRLRTRYGIDVVDYQERLDKQQGKCAICQRFMMRPCVDHDHMTGEVRGILCRECNLALAWFGEDGDRLMRAQKYLQGAKP